MIDVIPAPLRIIPGIGRFIVRPGMEVGCADARLAPIVERFCRDVTRRTGIAIQPAQAGNHTPAIRVELAGDRELIGLPRPLGVSPAGDAFPDERHQLTIELDHIDICALEPVGIARALTTLLQQIATTPPRPDGTIAIPVMRILDGPRYAWRAFSLDLAGTFFTLRDVERVIDLLALYKLDVLNLHLTDDEGWRIEAGRPPEHRERDGTFFTNDELRELVAYAEARFVTIVPEIDTPGHAAALLALRPELRSERNLDGAWLDPGLPATFAVIGDVMRDVATTFPSPYINIGGDEPAGMPEELYVDYVRLVRGMVRALGKRTMGWQESIRAGAEGEHVIQYWISPPASLVDLPPEVIDSLARARHDIDEALRHHVPVIVSPLSNAYFDVPYAEASADPAQEELRHRVGLRFHEPKTIAETFDWEPATTLGAEATPDDLAGVGATIWAETIHTFDELTFMLLPRLAGLADKAWSAPRAAVAWSAHRHRLARHPRLWKQDQLTYFQSSIIDWKRAA